MFNWSVARSQTQQEKDNGGSSFNELRCLRIMNRTGWKLLQRLKSERPQLIGQSEHLYRQIFNAVMGLQAAYHSRHESGFIGGVSVLEGAVNAVLDTKPAPVDLTAMAGEHPMLRASWLYAERDACAQILHIPRFEINATQEFDRHSSRFAYEAAQPSPNLATVREILNALHYEALRLFLEHFAVDSPEEDPAPLDSFHSYQMYQALP